MICIACKLPIKDEDYLNLKLDRISKVTYNQDRITDVLLHDECFRIMSTVSWLEILHYFMDIKDWRKLNE